MTLIGIKELWKACWPKVAFPTLVFDCDVAEKSMALAIKPPKNHEAEKER
ncbi:MAG: hypothetical protein P1V13_05600 [Rhizobiaceae bacterium]|nr:hypothetical protein [Rhizobiaceae bacterium]